MHGGGVGVSGRMGENQGGLRTGWLAAFGTEGYEGEPPLMEELGVNFGHIKGKVCVLFSFFSLLSFLSFFWLGTILHPRKVISEENLHLAGYHTPPPPNLLPSTVPHFPTLTFFPSLPKKQTNIKK